MILQYSILSALTFIGNFIGVLLGFIAPEELEPGAPWFIRIQDTIFTILIMLLIYYNINNLLIVPLILFLVFYWYKENAGKHFDILEFGMIGVLFGLGYLKSLFIPVSALTFVYFVSTGSLLAFRIKKIYPLIITLILKFIYYSVGLTLPLLFSYV